MTKSEKAEMRYVLEYAFYAMMYAVSFMKQIYDEYDDHALQLEQMATMIAVDWMPAMEREETND